MSTPYGQNAPTTWTYDGTFVIGGVSVGANITTASSTVIANTGGSGSEVLDTEVSVSILYGATITGGGVTISVCRRTLTGFQSPANDAPTAYTQVPIAGTTVNTTFVVRGYDAFDFELAIFNPAANSAVTARAGYRQSQGLAG